MSDRPGEHYFFDRALYEWLVRQYRDGYLCQDKQRVTTGIVPPSTDQIVPYERCCAEGYREVGVRLIESGKVAALILNGGMATRFGGMVKGLVHVVPGETFLGLKLKAIQSVARRYRSQIPVWVMNSFLTDGPTVDYIQNFSDDLPVASFSQSCMIRIRRDGRIFEERDGQPSYYAPGHGDFLRSLIRSKILERFPGIEVVVMSNVDNILATIDPHLVGFHVMSQNQMSVEVAEPAPGDKGGAPVEVDGQLQLLEGFRFPDGFNFSDLPVFNTNTFIFSCEMLTQVYPLNWYVIEKSVNGMPVIQFEQIAGELSRFVRCGYIKVPRFGNASRFFPIKTQADLAVNGAAIYHIIREREQLGISGCSPR